MIGDEIRNDPNRRCKYCNGREIIIEGPDKKELSNLFEIKDRMDLTTVYLVCRNPEECRKNQVSEKTMVYFWGDDKGNIVKKDIYFNGDFMATVAGDLKLKEEID